MKVLLLLVVSITISTGFPSINEIPNELGHPKDIRIIGGEAAEDGEFPWQVSIYERDGIKNYNGCGGSIINENYIVTSGACLFDVILLKNIHVVAGTNKLTGDFADSGQRVNASRRIYHEHFDAMTMTNDIGLIQLETPLVMNEKVQPVVLPEQMATVAAGTDCTVSGWGRMNDRYPIAWAEELMKATVPIIDDDECRRDHLDVTIIGDSNLCTGVDGGNLGPCLGDFGGPLVCDGVLHGISSWQDKGGEQCGDARRPAVYTEVAYFREWIDANAV